jgi:hypothetical protein
VIGLVHEHQRWDRDDHIEFRCHNLMGIFDAVKQLRADRPGLSDEACLDLLCSDTKVAEEYGAPSLDYSAYLPTTRTNGVAPQLTLHLLDI